MAGRFLQRDPLEVIDGPDLYQYAFSSPTQYSDPLGTRGGSSNQGEGTNVGIGVGDTVVSFNVPGVEGILKGGSIWFTKQEGGLEIGVMLDFAGGRGQVQGGVLIPADITDPEGYRGSLAVSADIPVGGAIGLIPHPAAKVAGMLLHGVFLRIVYVPICTIEVYLVLDYSVSIPLLGTWNGFHSEKLFEHTWCGGDEDGTEPEPGGEETPPFDPGPVTTPAGDFVNVESGAPGRGNPYGGGSAGGRRRGGTFGERRWR